MQAEELQKGEMGMDRRLTMAKDLLAAELTGWPAKSVIGFLMKLERRFRHDCKSDLVTPKNCQVS